MTSTTTAFDRLIDALRDRGGTVTVNNDKATAQCPAHDDGRASLSVGPRRDGKGVVVYCHAGCQAADIVAALALAMTDLFDDPRMRAAYNAHNVYDYPDGRKVHRKPGKQFHQSGNTKGNSLFHADRITADVTTVYIPEGEKDVLAIEAVGAVAVCSAMGAGKAHQADWSPLRGRHAIIVADNDEPGLKHATEVVKQSHGIAASARIVMAAVGKDVADHLAAGRTLDELVPVAEPEPVDGAELLDDIEAWFTRFIAVTNPDDLNLLALWAVHTHLVAELYTTPRLLIDSIMEGSGKSTVIDHLYRLCVHPVQAATVSSPALIPRLLEYGMRTILLDEAHRALRPDRPGVDDLIGIINTGYRYGATRPVLVPTKGGGWDANEMTTFAPVAMAGNNPNLPADTASRQIRVLLMPDIDGTVEDSDWEHIEGDARALKARIAGWADAVRGDVKGMDVALPAGCIGRCKERWRPLARVAAAAGGRWPAIVHRLIEADMTQEQAEREAGLRTLPPGMVMMADLHAIWPDAEQFMPTRQLVGKLIGHNPDYWGDDSPYGKQLTDHRLGRLVSQAANMTSVRPGGSGPRGYLRMYLEPVWHRLGIGRKQTGGSGGTGESGGETPFATGSTDLTGSTGLDETPTPTGAQPAFTPPTGPGRCPACGWHIEKQGHAPDCSANEEPF